MIKRDHPRNGQELKREIFRLGRRKRHCLFVTENDDERFQLPCLNLKILHQKDRSYKINMNKALLGFCVFLYIFLALQLPKTWPEWLISALAGGGLVALYLLREVQNLKEENKELKVRIGELENKTKFATTRNKILKKTALRTVVRLRNYLTQRSINEYQQITLAMIFIEIEQKLKTTDGEKVAEILKAIHEVISGILGKMGKEIKEDMEYFDEGFKSETLLLKRELEARLTDSNGASIDFYEKPIMDYKKKSLGTNYIAIIADDLEYLANQLN